MYICLCLGVTTTTVQQTIDAGARSTKQVTKACGAGSVCGRCRHTIRTMIEAAAPDPPSSKPDRLRRRWGRTLAWHLHLDVDPARTAGHQGARASTITSTEPTPSTSARTSRTRSTIRQIRVHRGLVTINSI
jgi:bacterioferritin-associated ferredoxin